MLPIGILAGGYGTRLGDLGRNIPKSLVEVNGVPFVDLQLKLLRNAGYKRVVMCVSQKSEQLISHISKNPHAELEVVYSFDGPEQLGTGGAIKNALGLLGSQFALIYGDSYLPIDYRVIEQEFLMTQAPALITVYRNENEFEVSNLSVSNGMVMEYEKNSKQKHFSFVDYGLSYWNSETFLQFSTSGSFDLTDIFKNMISAQKLHAFEVKQRFFEVGSISGIDQLSKSLEGKNE